MRLHVRIALTSTICVISAFAYGADAPRITHEQDRIVADVAGIALPMDVYRPTSESNGLGIIFVVSAGWNSNRAILDAFSRSYSIFAGNGYTVFAVRPGSKSHFDVIEMAENVNTTIRYVKDRAAEFGINPDRLGLSGWSAGGHLASLVATSPQFRNSNIGDTKVAAVGVFFPATSFLDWGGDGVFYRDFDSLHDPQISDDEIGAIARNASPAHNIDPGSPPFLLWHGDSDETVPVQQSQFFAQKLRDAGIEVELNIKLGGRHSWDGISTEIEHMSLWFDARLK